MAKPVSIESLKEMLDKSYERWSYLYSNGGSDPFWPDGVNLNLVRNHIISYKREIVERLEEEAGVQTSLFSVAVQPDDRPLPPEVKDSYMARPDQIRSNAQKTLAAIKRDNDAQFVLTHPPLDPTGEKALRLTVYKNQYYGSLERAIQQDNLVEMRRYENTDSWLSWFRAAAEQIRRYLNGQSDDNKEDIA